MTKQSTPIPAELQLPPVEWRARHVLGEITYTLSPAQRARVVSIDDYQLSARTVEKCYQLEDGQKVLVTERKGIKRPDGVDGVIRLRPGQSSVWQSHRVLEELKADVGTNGWQITKQRASSSWIDAFVYKTEKRDASGALASSGLRPPQLGGLHAIGAHWSLHNQAATIVMPTGTGKTETMLAMLVALNPGTLLVVVPSQVLRTQIANKFATLGLLRSLGNVLPSALNPVVGILKRRPKRQSDLAILDKCNVVVSTMSALTGGTATPLAQLMAASTDALIVDEAHHIAAPGWSVFRENFAATRVLQFTATPYRRDGKLVEGKVIYEYPLHLAQRDGYFKKIVFEPVYQIDRDDGDEAVAELAVSKLRADLAKGLDHLLLARCASITRARAVVGIYRRVAPDLAPVIVHSEDDEGLDALAYLRDRRSRIIVCVNMLGEGFDLPNLKIAAVHDTHKSLAVLLQFTGRFTRSAGNAIGDATVIANIADQEVSTALERLYSEDADWNQLLSEFSSEAARSHKELIEFLNDSERIQAEDEDSDEVAISHHLLRPTFSTLVFKANEFRPKGFFKAIPKSTTVHRVWLHKQSNTLYFVTSMDPILKWMRSRGIRDRQWDLYVLHFEEDQALLYLSSSDKSSTHDGIAAEVGATTMLSGDIIFRSLGRINRLVFQNVGVKKHGRRNLRFAMYTGADVKTALSISETSGSIKSNLSGSGWENGGPVTIGCSHKGRIWTREPGTVLELIAWCTSVGSKLLDDTIDTSQVIANVLIPEEVESMPDKAVLSIEWPIEILHQSEERVVLSRDSEELSIGMFEIEVGDVDPLSSKLSFRLRAASDEVWASLELTVGGTEGFGVLQTSGEPVNIRIGNREGSLERFLTDTPPLVRFMDLSELDGNLLIRPEAIPEMEFPEANIQVWDWSETDITKESIWKEGVERPDAIQAKAAQQYINAGFEVVFDDDAPGESADLVCLKEETDHIRLALVHCKFTSGSTPGERVKDVVEVSSQAIRSKKWKWNFQGLLKHIASREKRLARPERSSRFLAGHSADLNRFTKSSRFKEVRAEIVVVQPGVSKQHLSSDQVSVLAAAHSFLKETVGVDLDLVCHN